MKIDKQLAALVQLQDAADPAHLPYRRDIDGLRAIAVLSVVAFHAFPAYFRGGFIGVDIFFVISGFLISSILLRGLHNGAFSLARFYARRIQRIFPALLLVMGASLAFGWFALFPDEFKQLGKHVFGGAGFIANFYFWNEVGYFDTAAETKPLLHLWSLGIEEQFYIVWPLVLALAWKRRAALVWICAGLALLSFALNVGGIQAEPTATFYSPASRAWELLFGAVLACWSARSASLLARAPRVSPNLLSAAGALLLTAGLAAITRDHRFPGWYALLPVLGATLIIGAGPQAWLNRVVLSNRLMVWIGLISYPLYLWHWPLLSFAQIAESGTPSATVRAIAVGAALVLAALTYLLLERPLRHVAARTRVAVLALLMAALAGAGGYVYLREGMPARPSIVENALNHKALILVEDVQNAAACKKRYGFDSLYEYCLLANVDQDPTVVLIGDSHAYHHVAGLTKYYSGLGENLLKLGTRVPYWNLPVHANDGYQQATQAMLELALTMPSVKTVIFSTAQRFDDQQPALLPMKEAARDTFRRFLAAGKQVILIHDIPWLPFNPRACIKRPQLAATATNLSCSVPRAEAERPFAGHDRVLAEILREFPKIRMFDTREHMCDAERCAAIIDGRLMYRDEHHLSYDGDLYLGKKFAEWQKDLRID